MKQKQLNEYEGRGQKEGSKDGLYSPAKFLLLMSLESVAKNCKKKFHNRRKKTMTTTTTHIHTAAFAASFVKQSYYLQDTRVNLGRKVEENRTHNNNNNNNKTVLAIKKDHIYRNHQGIDECDISSELNKNWIQNYRHIHQSSKKKNQQRNV